MAFALSKILWWVLNPANLIALLLVFGLLLWAVGWRRFGRALLTLGVALVVAVTVLPMRAWLLAPLEDRFPAPSPAPERVDGIIVIGGAINAELTAARGQLVLSDAAERIFAFMALARRHPQARLVVSGGASAVFQDQAREADLAKAALEELGFDTGRVIFERESRNTVENARYSQALVQPKSSETWLLITSAYHMPRAVGIFRQVGWDVTAWPVDYGSAPGDGSGSLNFLDGLTVAHWALREWIGLVYYRLRGDIGAVFPAP